MKEMADLQHDAETREEQMVGKVEALETKLGETTKEMQEGMEKEREGMRKLVADAFDALNERVESGFEMSKMDVTERQTAINKQLEEQEGKQDAEREKLREALLDELGGARVEFEAAVVQLTAADKETEKEIEALRAETSKRTEEVLTELQND